MLVLNHDDIMALNISYAQAYDWVCDMISCKKDAILPAKISLKPMDGVFNNVMPSIIPYGDRHIGGVKLVTRYPGRVPSLDSKIIIYDAEKGTFLAFMDATWITAVRTGAVAAHSIKLLAKKNFEVIGMVGLGNTARATLLSIASTMPDKSIKVKLLKYKGQEEVFAQRFRNFVNFSFEYVEDSATLVSGSDVVVSAATYHPEEFCTDDCFDPGVLVVPIHTLGFTNCDLFFDKVYCDDIGHVKHFRNFDKFRYLAEVSDVVNNRAEGRKNDFERIIAYNIGISIHDVNFAAHIWDMVKDKKGKDIDVHGPSDKFWM